MHRACPWRGSRGPRISGRCEGTSRLLLWRFRRRGEPAPRPRMRGSARQEWVQVACANVAIRLPSAAMRLVTFGAGYVGLVTGTGLSELGHDVLCVDIDPSKVKSLNDGVIPIYEPGLGDLVRRNERSGRLRFATEVTPPWDEADAYFIAVGTPPGEDGSADVRGVHAAAEQIAALAKKSALVVIKSTVPVGTCDAVQAKLNGA